MTTNTPFHSYAYDPARDASRCEATIDPYHYGIGWDEPRCQCATGHTGAHVGRDRSGMNSGFTHAIRIRENVGCDRVDATPAPLAPARCDRFLHLCERGDRVLRGWNAGDSPVRDGCSRDGPLPPLTRDRCDRDGDGSHPH